MKKITGAIFSNRTLANLWLAYSVLVGITLLYVPDPPLSPLIPFIGGVALWLGFMRLRNHDRSLR